MRSELKSATRGGSDEISKTLQEGGHFLIRGGLTNPKSYKRGVSSNTDGRVRLFSFDDFR